MRRLAITIPLALVVLLSACSGDSHSTASPGTPSASLSVVVPPVTFERISLRIGEAADARTIEVEVAATSPQSQRGLGYRDSLAADAGMLFDLHQVRDPSLFFWMKGMRFPLDMVWIGEDRRVVGVTADVQSEPGVPDAQLAHYSPPAPVRYVLELNSGAAARIGVTTGTLLTFTLP
jgi:uncharacterized protein